MPQMNNISWFNTAIMIFFLFLMLFILAFSEFFIYFSKFHTVTKKLKFIFFI